jgi:hypothetical protein
MASDSRSVARDVAPEGPVEPAASSANFQPPTTVRTTNAAQNITTALQRAQKSKKSLIHPSMKQKKKIIEINRKNEIAARKDARKEAISQAISHAMTSQDVDEVMLEHREKCRGLGISWELFRSEFHVDNLVAAATRIADQANVEQMKVGIATDLKWRFVDCEGCGRGKDMQAYVYHGYHKLYALACQSSKLAAFGEKALIKRLRQSPISQKLMNQNHGGDGPCDHGAPMFVYAVVG